LISRKAELGDDRQAAAMLPILLASALVAASPTPVALGYFDGETLVEACNARGAAASAKGAVCLGYVSGAVDAILMQQAADRRTICPPPGLKLDALVHSVLARAAWAAKARGLGAASFVKLALEDAFPCRADQDVM
jgi:hypothetical protein